MFRTITITSGSSCSDSNSNITTWRHFIIVSKTRLLA